MPLHSRSRGALALFCASLRVARGLTQEELAGLAGVHTSTIKNVEADRDVSIRALGQVYRDGLTGKKRLTSGEWHLLIAHWLQREFPGGVQSEALAGAVREAESGKVSAHDARVSAIAAELQKLAPEDAQVVEDFTRAVAGKKGAALIAAVRVVMRLL